MKRVPGDPGSLDAERRAARLAYIAARGRRKAAAQALATLPPGASPHVIELATKALEVADEELSAAAWRVTDAFADRPLVPSEPPPARDRKR